ncbi:MAG: tyrosine-type recombinase/integrase [Planctomycetota bacterium]
MASLESRDGNFRAVFRLEGEKVARSLGTKNQRTANVRFAQVEQRLEQYKLGRLAIPSGCDPVEFILNGSKKPLAAPKRKAFRQSVTIKGAWVVFKEALPDNTLEETTLGGMDTHVAHLTRLIGKTVKLSDIDKPSLQRYIDKRSKEAGRYGRNVSVQTIKKELRTFSTIWNWMIEEKLVSHAFPSKKLRYPKFHEKPPFQTWKQIESRVKRGGLTEFQIKELWGSLFLDVTQVKAALAHAKTNARQPVIYPMLCFAAYTGARRSDILRSEIDDLDFASSVITIREKKRCRGKLSTRTVPMQADLKKVLKEWLKTHPGSNFTFADTKNGVTKASGISNDQASNFFEKTFTKSKWEVLHGWHLFRHSFYSNFAAAGIEQRVINDWVGHQTVEMVRRYRHLFPSRQQEAIAAVFK